MEEEEEEDKEEEEEEKIYRWLIYRDIRKNRVEEGGNFIEWKSDGDREFMCAGNVCVRR